MSAAYDVVVIGAGVIGLAAARELLRRDLSILILDKDEDVGRGASGRNSGVIHSGFAVAPGTLKAHLNVRGSRLMRAVCAELDVPFDEVGTLVVTADEDEAGTLPRLRDNGLANGLTDLRIIDGDELARLEPSVAGHAALFSPEGAIINPFTLVLRLADCCLANGASVAVGTEVEGLSPLRDGWQVATSGGVIEAAVVVNAAGVNAPDISSAAGGESYESFPCRGEYLVLDREARNVPRRMVYPVPPSEGGLGVHFTPTTSGSILIGPSTEYIDNQEDYATSGEVLARLMSEAKALCPGFDPTDVIASFAGVRAKISKGAYGAADFVVEESRKAPGLINAVGIESPGLSSAPAIAERIAEIVGARFADRPARKDFVRGGRPSAVRFADAPIEERARRAAADPDQRQIICRCEQVTRREVLDAIDNPLGARSLATVKARCRAGMGRCQGSFCMPRIVDLLAAERGVAVSDMTLKGPGSELFVGETKELLG